MSHANELARRIVVLQRGAGFLSLELPHELQRRDVGQHIEQHLAAIAGILAAAVDPDTTVTPIIPVVSEAAPVVAPEASSSASAAEAATPSVPVSPASAPEPVQPTTVPTDEPKTE